MPEYERDIRRLPPARLSPNDFRQIETALGPEYTPAQGGKISWDFFRSKRNNSSDSLTELLAEVENKPRVYDFRIVAEDEKTLMRISGDDDGCWIEYESSEDRVGDTLQKVRQIEGIFREHKRITNYLPNFAAVFRRPALDVGQPAFTVHLSRDDIIQGIITRWLSNMLTGSTGFLAGLILGWRFL